LGEYNSDLIKVHPELNCVSSPQPCVRKLATEIFEKNLVASTYYVLYQTPYICHAQGVTGLTGNKGVYSPGNNTARITDEKVAPFYDVIIDHLKYF